MKKEIKEFPSELRLDLVSNDWVVIASARARRPESFAKEKRKKELVDPKECPFCQEKILDKAVAKIEKDNSWFILSMPNDFPAFSFGNELDQRKKGPYQAMNGLGFQEVIITADHEKKFSQFSNQEMEMVVEMYHQRYCELMQKEFIKYVSLFHNHGEEAGASVVHPHSQIAAIPVLDPDLRGSLDGAESFYQKNNKCVYCTMIEWDIKDEKRIIYQNEKFVILCPFAPQASFEIRIYPKEHQPYFSRLTKEDKPFFADALKVALKNIDQSLNDPAYNFYIHTAPGEEGNQNYHWHLNILPKTSIMAGFELGAGIEISSIKPEKAAEFLRKQND